MIKEILLLPLYPLEFLMQLVLEFAYKLTGSYGFGLIALSAAVSVAVLPLYHIAEKWQDQERAIQLKMKPRIDELKAVFTGQELHSYLSVLYRQMGYNPLSAFRSTAGLLIQIPFFLAAYHFLVNYEQLRGIPFGILANLAKRDGLLIIAGSKINVLPYLMTLVNIVSSMIYSKKLSGFKEKVQIYGMAVLFLVLLYKSPSGLLVYWTCNNIFALIKNIFYRIFDKQYAAVEPKIFVLTDLAPLKKMHNHLSRFFSKGPIPAWFYLSGIFFMAALYLLNYRVPPATPELNYVETLLFLVMFIFTLVMMVEIFFENAVSRAGTVFVALYSSLWIFALYMAQQYYSRNNVIEFNRICMYVLLLSMMVLFMIGKCAALCRNRVTIHLSEKQADALYIVSAFSATLLTFLTMPSAILESGSVLDFDRDFLYYIKYSLGAWSVIALILGVLFFILKKRAKVFAAVTLSTILTVQLCNAFIFSGKYGDISNLIFQNGLLIRPMQQFANIVVNLILIAVLIYLFNRKKAAQIIQFFIVVAVGLSIITGHYILAYNKKHSNLESMRSLTVKPMIKLSKTGRNVVVLMLDRFIGGYVFEALNLAPQLVNEYDGFTHYPNSVTSANYTIGGIPALAGGYEYTIFNNNAQRPKVSRKTKINEAMRIMPYNFDRANFSTTIIDPAPDLLNFDDKKNIENTSLENAIEVCLYPWMNEKGYYETISDDIPQKLVVFGIFRVAPPVLRKTIYGGGRWVVGTPTEIANDTQREGYTLFHPQKPEMIRAARNYAILDFLPRLTDVKDDSSDNFVLMFNNASHEPWSYNDRFEIDLTGTIEYRNDFLAKYRNDLNSCKHVYADTGILILVAKWFQYLKDNGVYDNTRIIIVSDHGRDVFDPYLTPPGKKFPVQSYYRAHNHGLFMIKDFNQRGPMKQDYTFMTSSDTPWVAFNGIVDGENPYTGNKIEQPASKVPFDIGRIPWRNDEHQKFKYNIWSHFRLVKPDILDPEAWKVVNE